jgi:SNF2 family DNA or RNA helicase
MILSDTSFLSRFLWRVFVVDEAHRLKNPKTALYTTLKEHFLSSANVKPTFKVLVTGTPVQNNMQELWALLHFINPTMFGDSDEFQEWFPQKLLAADRRKSASFSDLKEKLKQFHLVLKPFMLRRKKADVLNDLPQKHEFILYTKLTAMQR